MITKRDYLNWLICPRIPKLEKSMSYEKNLDDFTKLLTDQGYEFENLVKSTFPAIHTLNAKTPLENQVKYTKKFINSSEGFLAEAVFIDQHNIVKIDVLETTSKGLIIYEIKASSKIKKEHLKELAYQKVLIEKLGYKIIDTYIIYYDGDYEFNQNLNLSKFLKQNKIESNELDQYCNPHLYESFNQSLKITTLDPLEVIPHCLKCNFNTHCIKDFNDATVFNLYNINSTKKIDYYNKGVKRLEDLNAKNLSLFNRNMLKSKSTVKIVNNIELKNYLKNVSYPVYYLDFETAILTIPRYPKTKPKQQNLFQYSLHIKNNHHQLIHKEHIIEPNNYDLESLVKSLVANLNSSGTVFTYNKKFEEGILKDLMRMFPAYENQLKNIFDRVVDLMEPFSKGYYYNPAFKNSVSLKVVLPTLFPDHSKLDYTCLNEIHDGMQATLAWLNLIGKPKNIISKTTHQLSEYCKLDTYAMVNIHEHLQNEIL